MRPVPPSRRLRRIPTLILVAAWGLGGQAAAASAQDEPAIEPTWRPGASFEFGVDSFSQIYRITDDLTGNLLDAESSFRDTTDVFTELRAAAEFSLTHEGPRLRSTVASRLSTGTELDREGIEWRADWRPNQRDRLGVDFDLQARQFREDVDFSLDSDNQDGRLRMQWQRRAGDWSGGLKARAQMLRFDTRSIYELDADRLDLSATLGWRDGWRHWIDLDAGVGTKDVRDSTAISYDHLFAHGDVGISLSSRWQLQLRPSVERRVYADRTVRRPFWDLNLDSQLEFAASEAWKLRLQTPLEYLCPDQNTSVYFDLFSGRVGLDFAHTRGAFEVGLQPRWSWLSSSLEVEDVYTQPSLVVHLDYFGSERWWLSLSEEWGDRRYAYDSADGLDLYSDYQFFRTSLLGGLRFTEHLSFEFFLSDEPESHRRDSDDSRLTLISASLRASL